MTNVVPPKQLRSRATQVAIAQTTRELLETHTYAELTISQIVKHAGSSTGSFYARFEGKRALLHFLHEEYVNQARVDIGQWVGTLGAEKLSLEQFSDIGLYHIVQSHLENRGILRAAMIEAFDDPGFSLRAFELLQWIASTIADIVSHQSALHDEFVAELQQSILAIIAILDQDLFYLSKEPTKKVPQSKVARLQRIFLASMNTQTEWRD